ncbi:hypothetical protein AWB95_12980 [Mycobacterium celatum]|uniref:ImmA/IrrE family metallo-endopeptidase n=2 Tax=Mycobacterium celatum TaxID=28045 RepID=A0A1X1RQ48_MYCCE|nr:hypothetical protein AWB95_12980 [Mycobacterium celatum]PIB79196.1 ImmA/IrrE family metallo-endopeptidase [Mycobacterium celatum]
MRPRLAARHFYDQDARCDAVPDHEQDEAVLLDIALAYRQAFPDDTGSDRWKLPATVEEMRGWLQPSFVRLFIDRVEQNLGVDVVRLKEITTSYTMTIGSHTVIVIPASGSWFYENWSIAHELGHIAAQDMDVDLPTTKQREHETRANAFAAELLLPALDVRSVAWSTITEYELATFIWNYGVSVVALQNRLAALRLRTPKLIAQWAAAGTFRLLRAAGKNLDGKDTDPEHLVAKRSRDASERRFPIGLQEAHMKRIAEGQLGNETLAWMLGVDADRLDEIEAPPEPPTVDAGALAKLLDF